MLFLIQLLLKLGNVCSSTHVTDLRLSWFNLRNWSKIVFSWKIFNCVSFFLFDLLVLFINWLCLWDLFFSSLVCIVNNNTNLVDFIFIQFFNSLINLHLFQLFRLGWENWLLDSTSCGRCSAVLRFANLWLWSIIWNCFVESCHIVFAQSRLFIKSASSLRWSLHIWSNLEIVIWSHTCFWSFLIWISLIQNFWFWSITITRWVFSKSLLASLRSNLRHSLWDRSWLIESTLAVGSVHHLLVGSLWCFETNTRQDKR